MRAFFSKPDNMQDRRPWFGYDVSVHRPSVQTLGLGKKELNRVGPGRENKFLRP